MKVRIDTLGEISLNDRDYLAQGGEAKIYKKGSLAIKIYHDDKKSIPAKKIQELSVISSPNVLRPEKVVLDLKNNPIGYTMPLIKGIVPLCKLFTRSFREGNNIDLATITELIKRIQLTTKEIHKCKILIVDGNEMNYLVDDAFKTPLFIDVDSYQTPSFPATALMESIRDRQVQGNHFTPLSDWFSFAIIAFQLYIGIHPYKGSHPGYKPREWPKRMDDGVSIFDPQASIPQVCYDIQSIPRRHLDWFKDVFVKNQRSIPPLADSVAPQAVLAELVRIIKGNEKFDLKLIMELGEKIKNYSLVQYSIGTKQESVYFIGRNNIYCENSPGTSLWHEEISSSQRYVVLDNPMSISSRVNQAICCQLDGDKFSCLDKNGDLVVEISNVSGIMQRDGRIYHTQGDKLFENIFISNPGGKLFHSLKVAGNILELSTKAFDGCLYQDILGKPWFMVPYESGKCYFGHLPELDALRVLEARSERNVLVVLTENKGVYDRYIFIFDENFKGYTCRKTEDIHYQGINFTTLRNGVCILFQGTNEIEIFKDNQTVKTLDRTPFDSSMKLFSKDNLVYFIDEKRVYSVGIRK